MPRILTAAARVQAPTELGLTSLTGVGPTRAARLAAFGITDVLDLIFTAPRKLEIWPSVEPIGRVLATLENRARRVRGKLTRARFSRFGGRSLLRIELTDASGVLPVLFFNQPWLRDRFAVGDELDIVGRVVEAQGLAFTATRFGDAEHPLPNAGSVEPVYPSLPGLSGKMLGALCRLALAEHGESVRERLEQVELDRRGLLHLRDAVHELHVPTSFDRFEAARRRIALEALLDLQAGFALRRGERMLGTAMQVHVDESTNARILASFPFELTAAQKRVAGEIRSDLERGAPMRRLLQGDVGSGKTVLGAYACSLVAFAGGQAAFLAPTELLAEQHKRVLEPWIAAAGLKCAFLSGSLGARARRDVLAGLAEGEIHIVFGTHALLGSDVRFAHLSLAVVDEQHRFGVAQRERLFDKGRGVHGLLMTATPIPRSLALTIYGDLDVSVLREKPPGRGAVITRRLQSAREVIDEIEPRLERGERVYWVVPRIEGDEEDRLGAEQRFERLRGKRWARFGVELVHGRLESADRGARLERFRRGEVQILVATTVIEVGVDVPEATVMVIESAERLGLAQLHQLRGRVGRGASESVCCLIGTAGARERLAMLESTQDGFEIAEEDLRRRGMGDLIGMRQAGPNHEGLDPAEIDVELLVTARDLLAAYPDLARDRRNARQQS